jgi:hypothetical protein
LPREINQQWGGSAPPFQLRNIKMDFENKVKDIDKKIAKLKKQRDALCAEAIDKDFAYFVQRTRTNTPNLSWWREQYPRSWEKYVTKSTYNKFAWKR